MGLNVFSGISVVAMNGGTTVFLYLITGSIFSVCISFFCLSIICIARVKYRVDDKLASGNLRNPSLYRIAPNFCGQCFYDFVNYPEMKMFVTKIPYSTLKYRNHEMMMIESSITPTCIIRVLCIVPYVQLFQTIVKRAYTALAYCI